MYQNFEAIIEAVKQQPVKKTICIANAASDKMLHLAHELQAQDICNMILVGDEAQIKAFAEKEAVDLAGVKVIHATETEEIARLAVTEVSAGRADVYVKGSMNTSDFLRSVLNKEVGLRTGSKLSVLTCYEVPGQKKLFFLTDGGMVVAPDVNDKAAIVTNAVNVLHNMGIAEPKVAILSSNEKVSEKIPSTVDAQALCQMAEEGKLPKAIYEGPIAFDVAMRVDGALALAAAVHADHAPGLELAIVERLRAEHADFLLHRKDRFQRRVLQIRFRQQAKNRRDAGSVVRAERRAVGPDDVILQNQLQRVFFKIVLNLRQLDANHVDVRL